MAASAPWAVVDYQRLKDLIEGCSVAIKRLL